MSTDFQGETAWLKEASPEETRRIVEALYRVHRLISAITDLNQLLVRIMAEGKEAARAEACSLMLYDAEVGELYFQVALGETGDQRALMREVRLRLGQGIAGVAAQTRASINVPDAARDTRVFRGADAASHFETRNLLAVPMLDRDQLIGVIEVLNKLDGPHFTDADLHVMEMFSRLAATAITNARLIEANLRKERLAAIGQAVAGLSHYTKNIITSMSGGADLVEQGLRQQDFEIIGRAWPVLQRSTRRISNVVQDMLSYSRAHEPARQMHALEEILGDVRQSFSELFAQRKVDIEVDTGGTASQVYLDANGVHRCLLNLLTNAADAVPASGGRVVLRTRSDEAGFLRIEVADNGPGVPEENIELVFEPFFSTKGTRGTGLGLAVSRKIAREHGGDLRVSRAPEGGALFTLTLPARPPAAEAARPGA